MSATYSTPVVHPYSYHNRSDGAGDGDCTQEEENSSSSCSNTYSTAGGHLSKLRKANGIHGTISNVVLL
jgi:hypothetical protein